MPVHDWTRVDAGIYHDLHVAWLAEIRKVLNGGLLPEGYYALVEQHAGKAVPDVLTLHTSASHSDELAPAAATGGTAVAEAPPRVMRHVTLEPDSLLGRRRTLAVRHISGHRLVALIEVMSPANKDRRRHLDEFVEKVLSALELGVNVLIVDVFPPGSVDPAGIHGAIQQFVKPSEEPYELPANKPLMLASYVAGGSVEGYLEHIGVGAELPPMPLFLCPERYVNVPLEPTYMAAYAGMPAYWRDILESPSGTSP